MGHLLIRTERDKIQGRERGMDREIERHDEENRKLERRKVMGWDREKGKKRGVTTKGADERKQDREKEKERRSINGMEKRAREVQWNQSPEEFLRFAKSKREKEVQREEKETA